MNEWVFKDKISNARTIDNMSSTMNANATNTIFTAEEMRDFTVITTLLMTFLCLASLFLTIFTCWRSMQHAQKEKKIQQIVFYNDFSPISSLSNSSSTYCGTYV